MRARGGRRARRLTWLTTRRLAALAGALALVAACERDTGALDGPPRSEADCRRQALARGHDDVQFQDLLQRCLAALEAS